MRRVPGKQVCAALDPLPHVLSIGVVGRCVRRARQGKEMVEMGESRTPRPETFSGDHYERVR